MKTIKLKNNSFEAIQVTGFQNQFGELKRFCGDDIKISYETCPIDDYWLIQVIDCVKDKWVTVPDHAYIVKLYDEGFTVVRLEDYEEYFIEDNK